MIVWRSDHTINFVIIYLPKGIAQQLGSWLIQTHGQLPREIHAVSCLHLVQPDEKGCTSPAILYTSQNEYFIGAHRTSIAPPVTTSSIFNTHDYIIHSCYESYIMLL